MNNLHVQDVAFCAYPFENCCFSLSWLVTVDQVGLLGCWISFPHSPATVIVQMTVSCVTLHLSSSEVLCSHIYGMRLLPSFMLWSEKCSYFVKNKLSCFLCLFKSFYTLTSWYFLSSGTELAFYIESRFWCVWQFCWPQLNMNMKTLLYLSSKAVLCLYWLLDHLLIAIIYYVY